MAGIVLPNKFTRQPQNATRLDGSHWAAPFVDQAYFSGNKLTDLGRNSRNLSNTGASFAFGGSGLAFKTAGNTSSYFSAPSAASTQFTIEAYYVPAAATNQYICGTQEAPNDITHDRELWIDSAGKFTFYIYDGAVKKAVSTTSAALNTPVHLLGVSDGTNIYLYVNGVLEATAAAGTAYTGYASPEFVIGTGLTDDGVGIAGSGWVNYAIRFNKALSAAEAKDRAVNKFSILQAPARRIWIPASASSDGTGSASGTSTVSGVGTSTAESAASSSGTSTASGVGAAVSESVGAASGTSTADGVGTSGTGSTGTASGTSSVSGVGASTAASDGVANGVALASGVGASETASTGTASGTSTVSGVGDSAAAGSAVGEASGTSTASGVGASIVAAVGLASGSSTVTGIGASTGGEVEIEDFGGDDAPIIIRKRKKKTLREQPNKHLEHILNLAVEEFQGKSRPTLKLKKDKGLSAQEHVLPITPKPAPALGLSEKTDDLPNTLAEADKDAEKVAQLLAVYQQQVAAQDDEDLLMLIAEFF